MTDVALAVPPDDDRPDDEPADDTCTEQEIIRAMEGCASARALGLGR